MIELTLQPVPPFRLDLTVSVLRRLPLNAMDRWNGEVYSRTMAFQQIVAEIAVLQDRPPERPRLRVFAKDLRATQRNETLVRSTVEKILGTHVDMAGFQRMAEADKHLSSVATRFAGFKPPRLPSVFETFVNGTACQQISLTVGLTLLNRLCGSYGPVSREHHAFPLPRDLQGLAPQALRGLGFSERKGRDIIRVATAIAQGQLDLESLAGLEDASLLARLLDLPGVGRWTAEYIALRGFGRLDVLPGDDVGLHARLQQWLDLKVRPDYDGVQRIARRYSPYRGLLYFYMLLDHQERKGLLQGRGVAV